MRFSSYGRLAGLAFLGALGSLATAHEHYFTYTYDWYTPFRFEKELELRYTHFEGGAGVAELEFEYGVTDRYVVAPYIVFEHEEGKTKFEGWKLEQRLRFGEFAYGRVLPAIYLEVEKENHEAYELEGKLIGTCVPNRNWVLSGNLIASRELESGHDTEWGYALGAARRLTPDNHVGLEAFGEWMDNHHWVGPTFGFGKPHDIKFLGTAGIPIAGGGPFQFRLMLEKEF